MESGIAQNRATSTRPGGAAPAVRTKVAIASVRTMDATISGARVRRASGVARTRRTVREPAAATSTSTLTTRNASSSAVARPGSSTSSRAFVGQSVPHGTSTPGSGTSTDTSTAGIHSTVAANPPATTMTRSDRGAQTARGERQHDPDEHELGDLTQRPGRAEDPRVVRCREPPHRVGRGEHEQHPRDPPVVRAGPHGHSHGPGEEHADGHQGDVGRVLHGGAGGRDHGGDRRQHQARQGLQRQGAAPRAHGVVSRRYIKVAATRRLTVGSLEMPEAGEDLADVLLHGPQAQVPLPGDGRVALALCDVLEQLALPGGQCGQGRARRAACLHQLLDQDRVDAALAGRHGQDRRLELLEVVDAVLQQVAPARGAALQQLGGELDVALLAQHDDPDLGGQLVQGLREPDALVGERGRHPDVGDHDVRSAGPDRGKGGVGVDAAVHHVDRGAQGQQLPQPLADQEAVVDQGDPDRREGLGGAGGVAVRVCHACLEEWRNRPERTTRPPSAARPSECWHPMTPRRSFGFLPRVVRGTPVRPSPVHATLGADPLPQPAPGRRSCSTR